jgi:uncharacterized protein (TIRG00374 family)
MPKKQPAWQIVPSSGNLDKLQYVKTVRRLRFFAILGLLASFGVFLAVAVFGGFSNVLNTIEHADPYIYLFAFVCVFLSFCMRYLKWNYYTKKLKLKVSQGKNFLVYLSSNAGSITPGNIGSIVAAYTLKKITNVRFSKIAPMVTMQLFTDFLGFAIFALVAAIIIGKFVLYVVILDIVLMIPFLLILSPWLFNILKKRKRKGPLLKRIYRFAKHYYVSQNSLNNRRTYLISLGFTAPADILNSMALYFSLLAVGLNPRIIASVFVFSTSQIFGMVTALPGGIGAADATFVALLGSVFHLSPALSSAVTIMARLATLWFGVLIGMVALIFTIRYWNNSKKSKNKDKKN